jgi:hypothetical protein
MYPMTTQPASDLRHSIWSLVFTRLGQASPPFGAGGLFGGRLVMQILQTGKRYDRGPSLGAGNRFLSHERPFPIQALGAANVGAFAFTFSYSATMAALLILAESPRALWENLISGPLTGFDCMVQSSSMSRGRNACD